MIDTKLNIIYNHFGEKVQFKKLAEECAEYLKAYHKKDELNMLDEAGDVYNVARGIYINNDVIRDTAKVKIERTLERIDEGFYDNSTAKD